MAKLVQSAQFERKYKKLFPNTKKFVNDALDHLVKNPDAGVLKKGDLSGISVYKFRVFEEVWLLSYIVDKSADTLFLCSFGPHDNFYRDLKKNVN